MGPNHMSRTAVRLTGATVAAAAVLGLSACGAANANVPRASGAATTTSAAAPSSGGAAGSTTARPSATPSVPAGAVNAADVYKDAPSIAQLFAQQALGDVSIVNSPTISVAVPHISAYLTDQMATGLIAKGNIPATFRCLPFKIKGLADGQPVTKAEVSVTSAGILQTTQKFTQVEVVADYKWFFGPQGWLKGTRTYRLTMVHGTDASRFAWLVDGIYGSDVKYITGDN
jgi:hypothetical protein